MGEGSAPAYNQYSNGSGFALLWRQGRIRRTFLAGQAATRTGGPTRQSRAQSACCFHQHNLQSGLTVGSHGNSLTFLDSSAPLCYPLNKKIE